MGFMGMGCITESDTASDMAWDVAGCIQAKLATELNEKHSDLNTPGEVNVALFYEEVLLPAGGVLVYHEGLQRLAIAVQRMIERRMASERKAKFREFLPDYKRMITALKKYRKEGSRG